MPRYSPIQERQSPKDKKLGQLAALAQLDEPRQRQQELASREHQQRVATAMQMLGLQQQQQNATAEQALRERALTQSGEQFGQQQQFAQQQADEKSGQFWGGTLPLQYTEQAGLESNRNAMQDHYKNADLISAAGATTDPRVSSAILGGVPGVASAREKIAAEDMAAKLQAFKMQMEATKGTPAQATVIASMPPEIRQQLLGTSDMAAQQEPAAVSGPPLGILPAIGNSLSSAASGFFNLPGKALSSKSPVASALFGDAEAERQQQMRMQGVQQLNDFVSQLFFGTDPQYLPDSPELQAQKRAALEAMSQRMQQQ
jgi:hypothetical protein